VSFLDRLRPARYRSPSGLEFTFEFRQLQRSGSKKAAVHELPQQNQADVQDLGQASTRFAIEASFSGRDYDATSDAFWKALAEKGPATLLHPRWGNLLVLALTISQTEQFVEGLARAVFEIEFIRVGEVQFPTTAAQAESEVGNALDEAESAALTAFDEDFEATDAAALTNARADLEGGAASATSKLSAIAATSAELSEEFDRARREFDAGIADLGTDPLSVATSYLTLTRAPSRALISIPAKLRGYGAVLTTLGGLASPEGFADSMTRILQFLGILSGATASALAGDLLSRGQAVEASELIQIMIADGLAGLEAAEVGGYVIPEEVLARLRDALARAAALMLQRSFELRTERRMVLDSDRTPLDLCYELYGEVDSLDDFIEQNALAGDEIMLIPRGREVAYYA
jgi:prophage DNA circulation protein